MLRPRILAFVLTLLAAPAFAQQRLTEHTLRLAPGEKSPPATIADAAFLTGHWSGNGLGGTFEEIWTAPKNGVMVGMYRGLKDGGDPSFYELLTIRETAGTIELRL